MTGEGPPRDRVEDESGRSVQLAVLFGFLAVVYSVLTVMDLADGRLLRGVFGVGVVAGLVFLSRRYLRRDLR